MPNLTFPILPAPSVFCNCQSPTIRYFVLLLDPVPLDECPAVLDEDGIVGWMEPLLEGPCLALSVLETDAAVSSLIVGSMGRDEDGGKLFGVDGGLEDDEDDEGI